MNVLSLDWDFYIDAAMSERSNLLR